MCYPAALLLLSTDVLSICFAPSVYWCAIQLLCSCLLMCYPAALLLLSTDVLSSCFAPSVYWCVIQLLCSFCLLMCYPAALLLLSTDVLSSCFAPSVYWCVIQLLCSFCLLMCYPAALLLLSIDVLSSCFAPVYWCVIQLLCSFCLLMCYPDTLLWSLRLPCWSSGKASASRAEDPRFESRLQRIFSGSSHTSDLKIVTPVATLPGAWRYRVSTGTGRPGVSILWLGEVEHLIWNFYLSVAAHKLVWADPSLRYTGLLLGR